MTCLCRHLKTKKQKKRMVFSSSQAKEKKKNTKKKKCNESKELTFLVFFFWNKRKRKKNTEQNKTIEKKKNAKKRGSLPFFSHFHIWDEAFLLPSPLLLQCWAFHLPQALCLTSPQSSVLLKLGSSPKL